MVVMVVIDAMSIGETVKWTPVAGSDGSELPGPPVGAGDGEEFALEARIEGDRSDPRQAGVATDQGGLLRAAIGLFDAQAESERASASDSAETLATALEELITSRVDKIQRKVSGAA